MLQDIKKKNVIGGVERKNTGSAHLNANASTRAHARDFVTPPKTSEKLIERKLREGVAKLGGVALKFTSPSFAGVPDRLILLDGRASFVELKSSGEKLTRRQQVVKRLLEGLGFEVHVIDTVPAVNLFLNRLKAQVC